MHLIMFNQPLPQHGVVCLQATPGDGIEDELLQHALQNLHSHHAQELVMRWLFVLYTQQQEALLASNTEHHRLGPSDSQHQDTLALPDGEQQDGASPMQLDSVPSREDDTAMQPATGGDGSQHDATVGQQREAAWAGSHYETVLMALLEGIRWAAKLFHTSCLTPCNQRFTASW